MDMGPRGGEGGEKGGVFHPTIATEVHHHRKNIDCWLLPAWAGVPLYAEAAMAEHPHSSWAEARQQRRPL
eukprot:10081127-Prorocentrum_lima.AAC.1